MDDMVHERFLRLTERPHQKLDDKNIHDGTYKRVTLTIVRSLNTLLLVS